MGYTDLDRTLMSAWGRAFEKLKDEPEQLDRILRRRGMSTYARPLRSWSLVLRSNDKRIDDDNTQGFVRMDRAAILHLCSPVHIPYPGVSLDEAAHRFGVNRTTVSRWANPIDSSLTWWQEIQQQIRELGDTLYPPKTYRVRGQRLMLEHELNRANIKRSVTRVWTPTADGLDPGGEVWSADWGRLRSGLAQQVPLDFVQELQRLDRRLNRNGTPTSATPIPSRVLQWVCPAADGGCGRRVYKLYLSMPTWTLWQALGGLEMEKGVADSAMCFLCKSCAGLVYESSERTSTPGIRNNGQPRRLDVWDRFLKRISGGVLTRKDVPWPVAGAAGR